MINKVWFFLAIFFFTAFPLRAEEGINQEELKALLGEAKMIEKDYEASIRHYRSVLSKDPGNFKIRVQLADVLSWEKQYEEAILEYKEALRIHPEDADVIEKLARVYEWNRNFDEAKVWYAKLSAMRSHDPSNTIDQARVLWRAGKRDEASVLLQEALARDPGNRDAKILLAEIRISETNVEEAVAIYRGLLLEKSDPELIRKLADALSWMQRYREAINYYDQLLAGQEDESARLQKARILGWDHQYSHSLREYQIAYELNRNERIREEKEAKRYYWNNRVKHAIAAFQNLLAKDSENYEARFDLSQIYSWNSMWVQAAEQYRMILDSAFSHFRAEEGLEKMELMRKNPDFRSGYAFFKSNSGQRDNDIKKHTISEAIRMPAGERVDMDFGYDLTRRSFKDYSYLTEHKMLSAIEYRHALDWKAGAFSNMTAYHKEISPVYEFGGNMAARVLDRGWLTVSHARERLENNSEVIRDRYYRDNYKARADADLNRHFKIGADYLFSYFSDSNFVNEPGADITYFLSLEPKVLSVKYRYFFRDFNKRKDAYFSPQDFSVHEISFRWRHYLNRHGIFYGAKDIYYEAGYDLSIDSTGIVGHKITNGFLWDITNRLQISARTQYTHSSASVYEDKGVETYAKLYF